MFFFLSKTAGILAQPIVIVCILFLVALLVKTPRKKKILGWSAFIVLMVFSNYFIALTFVKLWEVPPIPFKEVKGPYDYGVLLTGITKGPAGPDDRVYFSRGADRATHTVQLYKLGLVKKVLVSGGSARIGGGGVLEADELATFLILAGVREEDILLENRSQNTHQSAVEVAALVSGMEGTPRLLLVTSGYHLRRAKACFRHEGLQPDLFSTDPIFIARDYNLRALLIPTAEAFGMWQTLFKEWVGMTVYWMMGYI